MLQNNYEAQISRNFKQFWDVESYSTNKKSNFDILPLLNKEATGILQSKTKLIIGFINLETHLLRKKIQTI